MRTAARVVVAAISLGACGSGGSTASDAPSPSVDAAVVPTGGLCTVADDCADDAVCRLDSGRCVLESDHTCGATPGTGAVPPGSFQGCADNTACEAGQICVTLTSSFDVAQQTLSPALRACWRACDPCNPSCGQEQTCIALPEGGGVCSNSDLRAEGEVCLSNNDSGFCAAGRPCVGNAAFAYCLDTCAPEGNPYASNSADCGPDRVCADGTCVPGKLAGEGQQCSPRLSRWCDAGLVCGPDRVCVPGCVTSADCPNGVECFRDEFTFLDPDRGACIADGAVPNGGPCAEDRNCAPGDVCNRFSPEHPGRCQ